VRDGATVWVREGSFKDVIVTENAVVREKVGCGSGASCIEVLAT
jgi:hypothetical protein